MSSNEKSLNPQENPSIQTKTTQNASNTNLTKYIYKTKKWRVKLYILNESGQWVDHGVGYVFGALDNKKPSEQNENVEQFQKLIMINEETNEQMFSVEIKNNKNN